MATRGKRRKPATDGDHVAALYRRIYEVVRRIPRGRVATYGQVAELAGMPGAARVAGAAMRASAPEHGLPWQRVVGKKGRGMGKISILDPVGAGIQRSMLEQEGVELTAGGGIRLADYGWLPDDRPRRNSDRRAEARRGRNSERRAEARRPKK
jgi:methylated-DNA-protein-cysteine methyltransferase-like protein